MSNPYIVGLEFNLKNQNAGLQLANCQRCTDMVYVKPYQYEWSKTKHIPIFCYRCIKELEGL